MAGIELRPYQREALDKIAEAEARGVRAQMGVAATGLGKTVMFTSLAASAAAARSSSPTATSWCRKPSPPSATSGPRPTSGS